MLLEYGEMIRFAADESVDNLAQELNLNVSVSSNNRDTSMISASGASSQP